MEGDSDGKIKGEKEGENLPARFAEDPLREPPILHRQSPETWGLGFGVQGSGCRVHGPGCMVEGSGFRV